MRVIITEDYKEMSLRAAKFIAREVKRKPNLVLGLAAGRSPLGTYQELIRMHKEEGLDFAQVKTFNLDEYYGISKEHPGSFYQYMFTNFFNLVNIDPKNVFIPDGLAKDINGHCEWYEEAIKRQGGMDLMLMGIGRDGHIGFNEPGSSLGSRTRLKTLAAETIKDCARYFRREEDVPRYAITMGVGTIMEARKIFLLASGRAKARILAKALEGPITADVTASILQLHPDLIVIADEDATANLKRKKYHKYVEKLWLVF